MALRDVSADRKRVFKRIRRPDESGRGNNNLDAYHPFGAELDYSFFFLRLFIYFFPLRSQLFNTASPQINVISAADFCSVFSSGGGEPLEIKITSTGPRRLRRRDKRTCRVQRV